MLDDFTLIGMAGPKADAETGNSRGENAEYRTRLKTPMVSFPIPVPHGVVILLRLVPYVV